MRWRPLRLRGSFCIRHCNSANSRAGMMLPASWRRFMRMMPFPKPSPRKLIVLPRRIGRLSAERAAEWLRFVQRELRYFAFSLGEGGLTPRALEAIWSARFGDCRGCSRTLCGRRTTVRPGGLRGANLEHARVYSQRPDTQFRRLRPLHRSLAAERDKSLA